MADKVQSTRNDMLTASISWRSYAKSLDILSLGLSIAIFSLIISAKGLLPDLQIGPLSSTALHNLVIVGAIFIYGLGHGFRVFSNPLIMVYTLLIFNTFSLASRHPDLSLNQMGQSYANFILGMLLLHVNLKSTTRQLLWRIIPWMAISSVLVGLILQQLGIYDAFRYLVRSDVSRLQGASSPKDLAQIATVSMLFCLPLARQHRLYLVLGLVNYGIIALTASRTNMMMGALLMGVYLWPDIEQFARKREWRDLRQTGFIVVMVIVLTLLNSSAILNRLTYKQNLYTDSDRPDSSLQEEIDINSSGRIKAWSKYWDAAESNILFGRGLGAGTVIVSQNNNELKIPHNEYLRLIVDGGVVGLALVILAYAYVFWQIIRHTTFIPRLFLWAGIVIFAGLSVLDNTLTTQTFNTLFWAWWAVVAYNSFSGDETAPRFQFNFLKFYTGFPPSVELENMPASSQAN